MLAASVLMAGALVSLVIGAYIYATAETVTANVLIVSGVYVLAGVILAATSVRSASPPSDPD